MDIPKGTNTKWQYKKKPFTSGATRALADFCGKKILADLCGAKPNHF